jgi:hypothetical protein
MIILCWSCAGGARECRVTGLRTRGGTWRGRRCGRDPGPAAAHADRIQAGAAQAGAGYGGVAEILRGGDHELMRGGAGGRAAPGAAADRVGVRHCACGPVTGERCAPLVLGGPGRVLAMVGAALGRGLGAVRAAGGQRGLAADRVGGRLDDGTGRGCAASAASRRP